MIPRLVHMAIVCLAGISAAPSYAHDQFVPRRVAQECRTRSACTQLDMPLTIEFRRFGRSVLLRYTDTDQLFALSNVSRFDDNKRLQATSNTLAADRGTDGFTLFNDGAFIHVMTLDQDPFPIAHARMGLCQLGVS